MIVSERLLFIEHELQKKKVLKLKETAELLDVSESTVRRDFDELEKKGVLIRVFGGAMKNGKDSTFSEPQELRMTEKESLNFDCKRRLCMTAAEIVKDGNCVFLDGGTTFRYLFEALCKKRINIVTHSILYLRDIEQMNADILVLGGQLNEKYGMNVGPLTLDSIGRFHFDYAFIGCVGLNPATKAVSTADINSAAIKNAAINNAIRKVLVADSSKIGVSGFYEFTKLHEFDAIFIDNYPEGLEQPDNLVLCKCEEQETVSLPPFSV